MMANPLPGHGTGSRSLPILDVGCCEPLKATVHGIALGLATLMAAYNTAAWFRRRQRHLALNGFIYAAAIVWESRHVTRHLEGCRTFLVISDDSALTSSIRQRDAA